MPRFSCLSILLISIIFLGCASKQKRNWKKYIKGVDSFSSIRTADFNQDGVLDIVMGAGVKENFQVDSAVIAVNGNNGEILWIAPGRNQYVGSAIFKDINNDNVPDVFIGGRWAEFKAISGKDGKVIWEFMADRKNDNPADSGWFNFTSPQFIPDQDKDGVDDIIVANGGDATAWPTKRDRPAGRIVIISSVTGVVLSYATVPDGKETYMTPVCADINKDGEIDVFVGTGGETIEGHLYRTTLKDIMSGGELNAKIILTSKIKGFVSPPVLVDINKDGVLDIVSNQAEGNIYAINGATDSLIWTLSLPGTEIFNCPGVGFFNGDSIPDFFANFGRGRYPEYNMQYQVLIDGSNGKILFKDSVGEFQYASPVTIDINNDGYDEVIVSIAQKNIYRGAFSHLLLYDIHNHQRFAVGDTLQEMNITATTPWVGDLDGDGYVDIINSASNILEYNNQPYGMLIARTRTNYKISKSPMWGSYMGKNADGLYRRK
jgi:hypothetical protein